MVKPTLKMIEEMCGQDLRLVSWAYFGLLEVPLTRFYGCLNLDEVMAFSIGSRYLRENRPEKIRAVVPSAESGYDLFDWLYRERIAGYQNVFVWLNYRNRLRKEEVRLSEEMMVDYYALNQFGHNLEERLSSVDSGAVEKLKKDLLRPALAYVEPDEYKRLRDLGRADLSQVLLLDFQPKDCSLSPQNQKGSYFVRKIVKKLKGFSRRPKIIPSFSAEKWLRERQKAAQTYFPGLTAEDAWRALHGED